jgi:hypothetical protein
MIMALNLIRIPKSNYSHKGPKNMKKLNLRERIDFAGLVNSVPRQLAAELANKKTIFLLNEYLQ